MTRLCDLAEADVSPPGMTLDTVSVAAAAKALRKKSLRDDMILRFFEM